MSATDDLLAILGECIPPDDPRWRRIYHLSKRLRASEALADTAEARDVARASVASGPWSDRDANHGEYQKARRATIRGRGNDNQL